MKVTVRLEWTSIALTRTCDGHPCCQGKLVSLEEIPPSPFPRFVLTERTFCCDEAKQVKKVPVAMKTLVVLVVYVCMCM